MGLREAILITVFLGTAAAAAADTRPTKAAPKAAPAKTAGKPADSKAADKPDPGAPAEAEADDADDASGSAAEAEAKMPPHVVGPKHVDLGNNTSIDLPAGMYLFERATAQELLRKAYEPAEGVVAIVFRPDSSWHVRIDYADSGYIEDSDADDLDADELLESYRKGTAEQNKIRKSHGNAELLIDGWSEKPRYDKAAHHLIWGLAGHTTDDGKVINGFTRVLGRNGFLSLDLIDSPERFAASLKEASALIPASRFNPGFTYNDHASSDRSSGIGLRGLVLGGAGVAVASKLGFFGLILKILIGLKKGLILLVLGVGALFKKLFRGKQATPPVDPMVASSMATPPQMGDLGAPPPMGPPGGSKPPDGSM